MIQFVGRHDGAPRDAPLPGRLLGARMSSEWKSVLTAADAGAFDLPLSPTEEPYCTEERAAKLKHLQSERMTGPRRQLDFLN